MGKKSSKQAGTASSKRPAAGKPVKKKAAAKAAPDLGPRASKKKNSAKAVNLAAVQQELRKRWDTLNPQRLAAMVQLASVHDEIMQLPNVTGVHVGLRKRRMSRMHDRESWVSPLQFCIRVHVKEKLDGDDPRIHTLLPTLYGDTCVDVCQQRYSNRPAAGAGAGTSGFADPVEGGIPIAAIHSGLSRWGTLGGVVFSGESLRYLTNCHVVGDVAAVEIIQPPSGTVPAGQTAVIGTVVASAPIDVIDAALIKPKRFRNRSQSIVGIPSQVFVTGQLTPGDHHLTVACKVGAMTGFTKGIVKSTDATVIVHDKEMRNQIIVESMNGPDDLCDAGDSGSFLIVQTIQEGITINQIVGLVHAEGSIDENGPFRSMIACHFSEVQRQLGIRITKH